MISRGPSSLFHRHSTFLPHEYSTLQGDAVLRELIRYLRYSLRHHIPFKAIAELSDPLGLPKQISCAVKGSVRSMFWAEALPDLDE